MVFKGGNLTVSLLIVFCPHRISNPLGCGTGCSVFLEFCKAGYLVWSYSGSDEKI